MVELSWQGDVAVITMTDGENRFDGHAVDRWHEVIDELDAHVGPLAVVTTGTDRFYSNGLDLAWMGTNQAEAGPMIRELHRMWGRFLGLGAVTVAAVNGHAFGAGALLSSAHDRIVMREDRGYWCMPEVDLALPVGESMAALLSATLPAPAVHRALVTGHRFTGPEALAAGIVAELAPEGEVLDRAVAWAAPLAGKSREVIAVHKRILHGPTIDLLLAELPVELPSELPGQTTL
jgi:enoyl-CoA hydratase/carnithine racemase